MMRVSIALNSSTLLDAKFKSNNFSTALHGRFYENNSMQGSKMKKKMKKLDEMRQQRKHAEYQSRREQQKIEWMEKRLAKREAMRRKRAEEEWKLNNG